MHKKKSLGQHFLSNPHYLRLIADAVEIKSGETIVEIGPGEGTLTEVLLARGARVIALEKDSRLIKFLNEKFKKECASGQIEVIEGDALWYDMSYQLRKIKNYKVVGNIPYYISGGLFKKFLEAKHQPSTLVFLVQKEVAERIARAKKESILSLSIKSYGEPAYIKTVPRGVFNPPPKIDSAIMQVKNISRENFKSAAHEKKFFELLKKAFAGKRKMLRSTLGVDSSDRPEDKDLAWWLALASESL